QIEAGGVREGGSGGTVNGTLEGLRAILRRAVDDWEWLGRAPRVRMLKEPKRRVRYLTHEEAQKLLAALPSHLKDMAALTLETGLRRANVTGLQWTQVDLKHRRAWIHPDQAKARKAIAVPLNSNAVAIITKRIEIHPTHVFSFKGKPITQVSTKAWYQALRQAGISDFRWHDLRHTWASWHAQQGTPMSVLQELGGWESEEMVRRYAHFSPEHLTPYADRLRGVGDVKENADGTFQAQVPKREGLAFLQAVVCLARPAGFEPTTPWFVGRRPRRMSLICCDSGSAPVARVYLTVHNDAQQNYPNLTQG